MRASVLILTLALLVGCEQKEADEVTRLRRDMLQLETTLNHIDITQGLWQAPELSEALDQASISARLAAPHLDGRAQTNIAVALTMTRNFLSVGTTYTRASTPDLQLASLAYLTNAVQFVQSANKQLQR